MHRSPQETTRAKLVCDCAGWFGLRFARNLFGGVSQEEYTGMIEKRVFMCVFVKCGRGKALGVWRRRKEKMGVWRGELSYAGLLLTHTHEKGYAIGGLAGGEDKSQFWKVVHQCCLGLPDNKPRYARACV